MEDDPSGGQRPIRCHQPSSVAVPWTRNGHAALRAAGQRRVLPGHRLVTDDGEGYAAFGLIVCRWSYCRSGRYTPVVTGNAGRVRPPTQ